MSPEAEAASLTPRLPRTSSPPLPIFSTGQTCCLTTKQIACLLLLMLSDPEVCTAMELLCCVCQCMVRRSLMLLNLLASSADADRTMVKNLQFYSWPTKRQKASFLVVIVRERMGAIREATNGFAFVTRSLSRAYTTARD